MTKRWGNNGNSDRLYFLGLQNHCGWCLHPCKESYDKPSQHIKKQRHHFANKGNIVKPMVFPVVMHGCESCIIKKAEHWRIDAFELWSWRRLLRGEIKPVSPKGNQPWIFIGRSDIELKLQYFGHLMQRANSLEKTLVLGKIGDKRIRGQQRMRWLDSIIDSMAMNLRKCQEIVEDRGAWHAKVHGVTKSQTWLSDWTTT